MSAEDHKITTYNHMYTVAFEVPGSTDEAGDDVTTDDLRKAMLLRIISMDTDDIWKECIGGPEDTYEEQ